MTDEDSPSTEDRIAEGMDLFVRAVQQFPNDFIMLSKWSLGSFGIDIRCKISKKELEKKMGIEFETKYIGNGDLTHRWENEYTGNVVCVRCADMCEVVGTKKVMKIVKKEITPAVTEEVEEEVEVSVYKCGEGKEFTG